MNITWFYMTVLIGKWEMHLSIVTWEQAIIRPFGDGMSSVDAGGGYGLGITFD